MKFPDFSLNLIANYKIPWLATQFPDFSLTLRKTNFPDFFLTVATLNNFTHILQGYLAGTEGLVQYCSISIANTGDTAVLH